MLQNGSNSMDRSSGWITLLYIRFFRNLRGLARGPRATVLLVYVFELARV